MIDFKIWRYYHLYGLKYILNKKYTKKYYVKEQ